MSYELGSGEVLCPEVNFYRCYYLKGQLVVKFQLRYLHGFGHPVPAVGKVSDLVLKTKVCNYVHCSIKQWNQSNKNAKYKK
jgi:hypothetical protein